MPLKGEAKREYQRRYMPKYRRDHPDAARRWNRFQVGGREVRACNQHRFVGIDGEGWTDPDGRHHYMCLVAGEATLYTGRPLTTVQILNWISGLPTDVVYVGFFFDYDSTMILRDILASDPDVLTEIVKPPSEKTKHFTKWGKFSIQYVPRKHLSVRLYGAGRGGTVVIHDTRSFFQCKFTDALRMYGVGDTDTLDEIDRMKAERATFRFPEDASEIIGYCRDECRLLAELMGELRDRFVASRLNPWPYEGPGPVAGSVLKSRGFKDSIQWVPDEVRDYAEQAYYGGRFEPNAHGTLEASVWEYDVRSAYPYAMTRLPCLEHGRWDLDKTLDGYRKDQIPWGAMQPWQDPIWVAPVRWDTFDSPHPMGAGEAGPLPWRYPDGGIMFPAQGGGVYWSVEIPDYAVIVGPVWRYSCDCDCRPFRWVEDMYQQRRDMEAESAGSGLPLKLVLNSMYGKLAQRIGKRPYFNPVWAGLITAMTRRMIYDVYDRHPGKVVMFATDAVFVTEPCPELVLGSGLGEWEEIGPYEDLTVFQAGVYFDRDRAKFKTRGVPYKEFRDRAPEFVEAANDFTKTVTVGLVNHLGIRQCLAWGPGRYHQLGDWIPNPRKFTAVPARKRRLTDADGLVHKGGAKWSLIPTGTWDVPSTPYDWKDRKEAGKDALLWEEGLPDHTEALS